MTGKQIKNGEPEGVYAQEVPGVVCFQLEDVQQEVQTQFGSKAGKIKSSKLGKRNNWKPTKQKNKIFLLLESQANRKGFCGISTLTFGIKEIHERTSCTSKARKNSVPLLDVQLAILHQ